MFILLLLLLFNFTRESKMKGNIKKTTYKPNSCCPQSSLLSLCWSFACVWTHSWWAWSVGIEWVELQVASQGPSVIGKPLPQKRIIPPRVECGKLWLNKPQLNDTHLAKKTRTDDPKIPVLISLQPCACSWPQKVKEAWCRLRPSVLSFCWLPGICLCNSWSCMGILDILD